MKYEKIGGERTSTDGAPEILKPGYVLDYVGGAAVKATPEEVEAVQVIAEASG